MPKRVRARAVKALSKAASVTNTEKNECRCCSNRNKIDERVQVPTTSLTPELHKANDEGWKMITAIAFPSLPAILQDLWVYLELALSIAAFAIGFVGLFPIDTNVAFESAHLAFTILGLVLALIDGFIYFVELGSCTRSYRYYKKKLSQPEESEGVDEDVHIQRKSCCKPEIKEKINTFFEMARSIISELVLYPTLVLDLFSFIVERSYQPEDAVGRADYGLFIIGSFYLIIAVYVMRIFVLVGSIYSLTHLPVNTKGAGHTMDSSLMIKFCFHSLGQILVHLLIVIVIAAKINNENRNMDSMNGNSSILNGTEETPTIRASPFLWTSIVLGWLLPLAGTAAFFAANYYWIREFSVGFWLNMISLLQGASFAESVFGDDGLSDVKSKALEFVDQSDYLKVKKQLTRYKSPPWYTKFFYPSRVPVVAISALIYDICLFTFIFALMFTYTEEIELVILEDDKILTITFFVCTILIVLANIHNLVLINLVLFGLIFIVTFVIIFITFIVIPLLVFVYLPLLSLCGYCLLVKQICCSCSKPSYQNDILTETKSL